jgi:hypothetical protein
MRKPSREHLLRIGDLVVEGAALEVAMADAIWQLLLLDPGDGHFVVRRIDLLGKIELLRGLALRYLDWSVAQEEFFVLLRKISAQLAERDFIVHATWSDERWGFLMASGRTPTSFRSESCAPEWMAAITEEVRASRAEFDGHFVKMMRACKQQEVQRRAAEAGQGAGSRP